jgi:conjugative transfer signal peptidase TraF
MMNGPLGKLTQIRRTALVASVACVGLFQLCGFVGLRINTSPSMPLGLYLTTQAISANLIEFCPAEPFAALTVSRGYRSLGVCPDGAAPLLKPVVAKSGDIVEISAHGIEVNGTPLRNTAPLAMDTKGRPLKAWPFGRYEVAAGTVWVASSYNLRSFDSRYFGPVEITSIRSRLRPFLTL